MRPRGLKPALILVLRGAEAPLFHRAACIYEFFATFQEAAARGYFSCACVSGVETRVTRGSAMVPPTA